MKKLIFILLIINLGCSSSSDQQFINRFVTGNAKLLNTIKNNDIQVKLTVIDSIENFIEYEYTKNDLDPFTAFAIKIRMQSSNSAQPPRIKDLRAIALAT